MVEGAFNEAPAFGCLALHASSKMSKIIKNLFMGCKLVDEWVLVLNKLVLSA
jgi:hypothetical protein